MNNYQNNNRMNPQMQRMMRENQNCRMPEPKPCPTPCSAPQPQPCPTPCGRPVESCPQHVRPRNVILKEINEVSFAVNDMNLYLDSHPCDDKALEYMCKHIKKRNELLHEYAKSYGPLTIDTADDAMSNNWEWTLTPWPWEGGNC